MTHRQHFSIERDCVLLVWIRYSWRPALIVVPLSTIHNWASEFERWAPHLNVVTFAGNSEARQLLQQYELRYDPQYKSVFIIIVLSIRELIFC
jgi:SNF2 family DNA or RNA helicase